MTMYQLFLLNTLTNQAIILKTSDSESEILKLEYDLAKALASVPHAQLVLRVNDIK